MTLDSRMSQAQATGVPPPRVGAVDMGSRNFKFVIGQKVDGVVSTELVGKERLDLGREISENDGFIGRDKLEQMQASLARFAALCRDRGATTVLAVATSAIRNARNQQAVVDLALEKGIHVEVADGAREGRLGYLAATRGAPNKLVSDFGSKSLQVAWEADGAIHSHSMPVGYELAYESFVERASSLDETMEGLRRFLDGNVGALPPGTDGYIALAANAITSFVTGEERVGEQPRILTRSALNSRLQALRALPSSAYQSLRSSLPNARKVLPGLVLIDYVMGRSGHEEAQVADGELPVGLIVEHFIEPA